MGFFVHRLNFLIIFSLCACQNKGFKEEKVAELREIHRHSISKKTEDFDFERIKSILYFSNKEGIFSIEDDSKNLYKIINGNFEGIAAKSIFGKTILSAQNNVLGFQKFYSGKGVHLSADFLKPSLGEKPRFLIYKNQEKNIYYLFAWGKRNILRQWKVYQNLSGKLEKLAIQEKDFVKTILKVEQYKSNNILVLCNENEFWITNPTNVLEDKPRLLELQNLKPTTNFVNFAIYGKADSTSIFLLDSLGVIYKAIIQNEHLFIKEKWAKINLPPNSIFDFEVIQDNKVIILMGREETNHLVWLEKTRDNSFQ
tara:strand:- start:2682 stop:3617 length:936 start_codon:yes stop_codon:yes gene_type:complete